MDWYYIARGAVIVAVFGTMLASSIAWLVVHLYEWLRIWWDTLTSRARYRKREGL